MWTTTREGKALHTTTFLAYTHTAVSFVFIFILLVSLLAGIIL
jgi:hypothetical protein